MKLAQLLAELKRRRVLRVAGAYLVGSAVAVQVASDLLPALRLPEWTISFVAALAIIGFPVAVVLAWAFDLTPDGLRRASKPEPSAAPPVEHVATTRREARAALRGIAIFVVFFAVVTGAWYGWRRDGFDDADIDPDALVVLPLRFAADPSLDYLREGMVDLLAAKFTGEGGPRAVDARPTLSAWRRAVASESDDLEVQAAVRLARSLGAGQVLVGGIIGTPGHFTVTAALHALDGSVRARAEVEGTADELAGSIDRLVAELLSLRAGEERQRLATLTSASLPALRSYLAGQAEYRRGSFEGAAGHYADALDRDTTFALAALGLYRASGWSGGTSYARGERLAWQHRDRLPPRDREFLVAWFGEAYPDPQPPAAQLRALESYVATFADHAEAWYELGDALFHRGGIVGYNDALDRSLEAFRMALRLDPVFAPARVHLMEGLIILEDTAALRREAEAYFAQATEPRETRLYGWMIAMALGDAAALARARAELDSLPFAQLDYLVLMTQRLALPASDARSALELMRQRAIHDGDRLNYLGRMIEFEANAGRFSSAIEAARQVSAITGTDDPAVVAVVHGIGYPDADADKAAQAARSLEQDLEALAYDPERRTQERNRRCMVAQHAVHTGDMAAAHRHQRALVDPAQLAADATMLRSAMQACALMIDAATAVRTHAADADAQLARFERFVTTQLVPAGLREYLNYVAAHLHAERGDHAAALAALHRRDRYSGYGLSATLLLRARLLAHTGDTEGAIRAYRHYLALRPDPEPGLPAAEVAAARRELAALIGEARAP